ncbi:hypothetical protein ACWGF2_31395 [Streptomyces sp. NPDC054919]
MVTFTEDLVSLDAVTVTDIEEIFTEVYTAPTACTNAGGACWWDSECCPGMICSWFKCAQA